MPPKPANENWSSSPSVASWALPSMRMSPMPFSEAPARGDAHRVGGVAREPGRVRHADAELEAIEEPDGGVELARELVVDDVGRARLRARRVERVGAALVVQREAEREPLVVGHVGAVDREEVVRAIAGWKSCASIDFENGTSAAWA